MISGTLVSAAGTEKEGYAIRLIYRLQMCEILLCVSPNACALKVFQRLTLQIFQNRGVILLACKIKAAFGDGNVILHFLGPSC